MVLNEMVRRLGVAMRQTEDELMRDMMTSTTSYYRCANGGNGDSPSSISDVDFTNVQQILFNNNARTILDSIEAMNKFSTGPVRNSFIALCSTHLTADFENRLNGFRPVAEYPQQEGILRSEYGTFKNFRFLVSSIGSVVPSSSNMGADVYNIFCLGMEAVAAIEQDRYSASLIYLPAYIVGGPLALNASIGYKMSYAPAILNDEWIIKMQATLFNA